MGVRLGRLALVLLACCAHERAGDRPVEKAASKGADPPAPPLDPAVLCKELFPCPPSSGDEPPFMCALGGERLVPAAYASGLIVESLSCPFRRGGMGAVVGVPRDGSRPLVQGDALLARVRPNPRARAIALAGGSLADERCPIEERAGLLRYCVTVPFKDVLRCVADGVDAVGCATREPERFLSLCASQLETKRVVAEERYWGPGGTAVASDHVRDGRDNVGRAEPELRASGRVVRVLTCRERGEHREVDSLVVDGASKPVAPRDLLSRLDDVPMRAAFALRVVIANPQPYLLLDPSGDRDALWPADRKCVLPPGPRERDGKLVFYTAPAIKGPYQVCEIDTKTWTGACETALDGKLCE
ncbi:MAG: hypothetical protein KF819_17820 [Labilithrix sp.]|nr:hypothetical protein [Labilithrix sp.]